MTPFRWALLCLLFTLYLLLGGSVFMLIEQHHEIHQKEELHVLRQDIQEILFRLDRNFYDNATNPDILDALTSAKEGVLNRISQVCQLDNLLEGPEATPLKWNYYNSVFFSFTVVTTIGYGHLSPSTSLSKSLMILYALFGIPLNGILLSGLGDYFSNKLVRVHQKSKDRKYRGKTLTLVFEIIFYLIPGIVVFIIIPAGIFVLIENWTFLDSIYYAFVSLTTIGFGDYVAGMGDGHNVWLWIYKAFIIIWITFGLGYLIMILGFIAKGMKSKQVRGILDKRLSGIRTTKEKLSKDIDYMRRIVNELYLMKLKPEPGYEGEEVEGGEEKVESSWETMGSPSSSRVRSRLRFDRRCSSLPRLSESEGEDNPVFEIEDVQSTAPSPFGGKSSPQRRGILKRRVSDSDISRVDLGPPVSSLRRDSMTPEEMLDTVVSALTGNMQKVMNAVDELNKYELEVENARDFGRAESLEEEVNDDDGGRRKSRDCENCLENGPRKENGAGPPWEIRVVSESDEDILLDGKQLKKKSEPLDCVVVHKSSKDETDGKGLPQSFMEKVSEAIRKLSGAGTPPETPSRKISRNESDKKRKISRAPSEASPRVSRHHHYPYSPFARQPSSSRWQHSSLEASSSKHHPPPPGQNLHSDADLRKISRESRLSTASYQTIDEIISCARASRKNTPAHYHPASPLPPILPTDEVDDGRGRSSLESSTSSFVHFLKALDNVQDRLKKTSTENSFSGSCFSDYYSDGHDMSGSYGQGSPGKGINGHHHRSGSSSKRSVLQVQGVDRRRKNGIFQPGFSYVNFGFNAEEDEDDDDDDVNEGDKEEGDSDFPGAVRVLDCSKVTLSEDEFTKSGGESELDKKR